MTAETENWSMGKGSVGNDFPTVKKNKEDQKWAKQYVSKEEKDEQ